MGVDTTPHHFKITFESLFAVRDRLPSCRGNYMPTSRYIACQPLFLSMFSPPRTRAPTFLDISHYHTSPRKNKRPLRGESSSGEIFFRLFEVAVTRFVFDEKAKTVRESERRQQRQRKGRRRCPHNSSCLLQQRLLPATTAAGKHVVAGSTVRLKHPRQQHRRRHPNVLLLSRNRRITSASNEGTCMSSTDVRCYRRSP